MATSQDGWAGEEFLNICFGDKRLNKRLVKICNSLSESPESPINQACGDWAETKGAYRFFDNESVNANKIISAHTQKTERRAQGHDIVLAIQDTCFFTYTNHIKLN